VFVFEFGLITPTVVDTVADTLILTVLNPPVSFPMIVNKAFLGVVRDLGLIKNLVPTRVIVWPAVVTEPTSSSTKLVTLASAACTVGDTAPPGATSIEHTVSSDNIAVYPAVVLAPGKFNVAGVIVEFWLMFVNVILAGDTLITGIPITSFGRVTNL
jgi:hypothetical protein